MYPHHGKVRVEQAKALPIWTMWMCRRDMAEMTDGAFAVVCV